jgi:hypothetical protein
MIKGENKKAAIELSIGTMVIIVLAMTMLILGIVLVTKIMGGATESTDTLNAGVKAKITSIFTEEGSKIAFKLSSDKLAKIKAGSGEFGIAFGAQTGGNPAIDSTGMTHLSYDLTFINPTDPGSCGSNAYSWFKSPRIVSPGITSGKIDLLTAEGANGFGIIYLDVPKGSAPCTQSIQIKIYEDNNFVVSNEFRIQIITGGIFS